MEETLPPFLPWGPLSSYLLPRLLPPAACLLPCFFRATGKMPVPRYEWTRQELARMATRINQAIAAETILASKLSQVVRSTS